jgi:6-pyruvoyltetrahydropterin/6-carboxytetrahydropterin synthase
MWTLEKAFSFEASHRLPHHGGKCSRLHGHSWKGRLVCSGDVLATEGSSAGMLVDYGTMSRAIEGIVETHLDHHHLNDTLELENPTSEEVARWIYQRVKAHLPTLVAVIVEETCTSRCTYAP